MIFSVGWICPGILLEVISQNLILFGHVWCTARWRSRWSRWTAWSWLWYGSGCTQGCGRVSEVSLSLPPSLAPSLFEWLYSLRFGFYFSSWCVALVNFFRRSILGIKVERIWWKWDQSAGIFIFFCTSVCSTNVIIYWHSYWSCIVQDGGRVASDHRGLEPMAEDIGSSKQAPVSA